MNINEIIETVDKMEDLRTFRGGMMSNDMPCVWLGTYTMAINE